ncbi:hypothetical protein MHYP_G00301620 [Metynnis hypsauchen]
MRCCLPVVFLLLVQKVSLQDVQAVVGDAVILPCSSSGKALQDTVAVFWRFQDSVTVCDIEDGRAKFDEQAVSYKNRVESFPAEWTNGNFSIKLSDVRKTDGGLYICFLPTINAQMEVQLTVKDRPVTPTERNSRNSGARRGSDHSLLLLAFLLGCSLLCA